MRRIRIPTTITSEQKTSPYMQMYRYIASSIGKKKGLMNQSAVFVSPETGAKLKNMEYKFFRKGHTAAFLERAFPWHWLDFSPAEKTGVQNGYAEVDVNNFYVKERK